MIGTPIPRELDSSWLDVNFPVEAERYNRDKPAEQHRLCGLIKEDEQVRDAACLSTPFASKLQTIPESQWETIIKAKGDDGTPRMFGLPSKSQIGNSCTSNAMDRLFELRMVQAYGREYFIQFSPMSLYQFCCGGRDAGSSLSCNMETARTKGFLPSATPINRDRFGAMVLKDGGYTFRQNPRPDGWEPFAQQFVVVEWLKISTVNEFATCLLLNIPVLYGRSGHALCGVALVIRNRRLYCMYDNSWGTDWGDHGYGYDSFGSWLMGYGCYAAVTIRHPKIDGLHLPPTPVSLAL